MRLRTLLAAASCAAGLVVASGAGAVTYSSYTSLLGGTLIDFEDQAGGTLIDTQYLGVTFGQTPGGRPQIDEYPWIFGYGASSGSHVLTGSTEGGNAFDTIAGLTVAFKQAKKGVEFFFSDTVPLGDYPIVFYGKNGVVLDTFTLTNGSGLPPGYAGETFPEPGTDPLPGIFIGYVAKANDIYGIGIGPSRAANDSFAIDDLRFTTVLPEPASWAMIILGLGAAGAVMRRRRAAIA